MLSLVELFCYPDFSLFSDLDLEKKIVEILAILFMLNTYLLTYCPSCHRQLGQLMLNTILNLCVEDCVKCNSPMEKNSPKWKTYGILFMEN